MIHGKRKSSRHPLRVYTIVCIAMKLPSEQGQLTTASVPTRFFEKEADFLTKAKRDTGMSVSELVRRSVRLMQREQGAYGSYNFLIELTP